MIKSVLAVSEGGPDAAMSFKLAARVAGVFGGAVDALHLPVGPAGGMVGGLAMSGEAMPLVMNLDDERLEERAKESERAYKETLALIKGATYTAAKTATLDAMVAMGSKDGNVYGVQRESHKRVYKTPVTTIEKPDKLPDAQGVGQVFREKLGYETRVVPDATRADIVNTLNQLAREVRK